MGGGGEGGDCIELYQIVLLKTVWFSAPAVFCWQ